MHEETGKEHQWLQGLVGNWSFEGECIMGPDQPPSRMSGAETVRTLGDRWVICESTTPMPEMGTATNLLSLGFDPAKGKFVGTFMSSAMNALWVYEGTLDAGGTVLTLDTEGPSMTGEGRARYQDIIELKPSGERGFSSRIEMPDGQWVTFMTSTYVKKA
jgi:hypothetical protein